MIFTKFEILHLKPKLKKAFETSFGRFDHNETLLVKSFTKEGLVGFGEAPAMQVPFYNYESSKIATLVLKEYILPQLLNKEIKRPVISSQTPCLFSKFLILIYPLFFR